MLLVPSWLLALAVAGSVTQSPLTPAPNVSTQRQAGFHATGELRAFGPNRSYALIAHDAIPGVMAAMTMSFEPGRAGQLDGLSVGDRVVFDFVEAPGGHRVLTSIARAQATSP